MSHQVGFAKRVAPRCIAGSPARRRGNFLLRGQKKVTKEEALNRTRAPHARAAPCNSRKAVAQKRTAALSRQTCDEGHGARFTPPNVGCTPDSPANTNTASPERRCIWLSAREHGVQPRVRRADVAMSDGGDKDSSESAAARVFPPAEWLLHGAARACGAGVRFRASSLVTFFWPRRRKLPRRRAGLPAMQRTNGRSAKAT